MKIQAHRGASAFAPENTLEAFRLGLDMGADGLELDVHLTRDGEVVVFHDMELARMTGQRGRVCDRTLSELKRLDFPIPTLEEVYTLANAYAKTRPLTVNVEIKTDETGYPALPAKLIAHAPLAECDVLYSSFNHYALRALRELDASARIGLLYRDILVDPHLYAKHLQADALHPPWQIVAALPHIVADCHAQSIAVNVWTVNDERVAEKMRALGVDTLITDKLFPRI